MRFTRPLPLALVLLAPVAQAQSGPAAAPEAAAPEAAPAVEQQAPIEGEVSAPQRIFTEPERRDGFTSGLRLGFGLPLGKAGQDAFGAERDLGDLASWRAPIWVDVGYSFGSLTLGAYVQLGVGGVGDACAADCDWSDIRFGVEGELRLARGAVVDPWLGLGLGYEALSFRTLAATTVPDATGTPSTVNVRAAERFLGPEAMVQGGVDFQVDDALRVGPYAVFSAGQYVTDSYNCTPDSPLCPRGSSVDGGAFHAWVSFGLRGAYTP